MNANSSTILVKDSPVAENLASLAIALSNAMRPAWRLANQRRADLAGERQLLPAWHRATKDDVKAGCELIRQKMGSAEPFVDAVKAMRVIHGEISDWVDLDHDFHAVKTWGEMIERAAPAIGLLLDPAETFERLTSFDWQRASEAATMASFIAQTAILMGPPRKDGRLPEDCKIRQRMEPGKTILVVEVVGETVLGRGDHIASAVDRAIDNNMTLREPGDLTETDFIRLTHVVNVEIGRGKTGTSKTGPRRLLARDASDLDRLRALLGQVYDTQSSFEPLGERKAWIDQSVKNLLASAFDTPFKSLWIPGGGHLVLNAGASDVTDHVLIAMHRDFVEQKQKGGEVIATSMPRNRNWVGA